MERRIERPEPLASGNKKDIFRIRNPEKSSGARRIEHNPRFAATNDVKHN